MKKLLFSVLLIGAALGLKAQYLTIPPPYNQPNKGNQWRKKLNDSIFGKFSFKPNQKVFVLSDSVKRIADQNKYIYAYDRMPVAKLQINDNMPVMKPQGNSKMPVYNPDNNSLINLSKPTLRP